MFRHISALAVLAALSLSSVACGVESLNEANEAEETSSEIVSRSASFETFEGLDGRHYFHVLAGNGANLLRSQGYASRGAAEDGIQSVLTTGPNKDGYEILEAANGDYYFNVRASNGQVLGTSQLFASRASADRSATTLRALIRLARQQPPRTKAAPHSERFELFTGEDGKDYFRLRAGNGEILLTSQAYSAKAAAKDGIASVKTNGVVAASFEVVEASGYAVNLVAANGEVVARGESYSSKSNATRAVNRMVEILSGDVVMP